MSKHREQGSAGEGVVEGKVGEQGERQIGVCVCVCAVSYTHLRAHETA